MPLDTALVSTASRRAAAFGCENLYSSHRVATRRIAPRTTSQWHWPAVVVDKSSKLTPLAHVRVDKSSNLAPLENVTVDKSSKRVPLGNVTDDKSSKLTPVENITVDKSSTVSYTHLTLPTKA